MKLFYIAFIIVFFHCCNKNIEKKVAIETNVNSNSDNISKTEKKSGQIEGCTEDLTKMLTSEYENIKFYTENALRGKGVVQLSVNSKITILNSDKTVFGSINFKNDSYILALPSKIIAREILPDSEFQIFSFDSELPDTDKDFLLIYINKQKKLILKKEVKYSFRSWEDYIKSAFIQLSSNLTNANSQEQTYWYEVIAIKNDSMQIKSVPKTSCDYIDKYKDVTKLIKWKSNDCKLIKFNFCY